MIETILRKIAARGERTEAAQSAVASTQFHESQPSKRFPLFQERAIHALEQAKACSEMWQKMVAAHRLARTSQVPTTPSPPGFGLNSTHAAIAQLIWDSKDSLERNVYHLASLPSGQMIGELLPKHRQIKLLRGLEPGQTSLALRAMPSSMLPLSERISADFERHSIYTLLWFLGQMSADAPSLLPPAVMAQPIQMRKLPSVPPASLEVRHLALFYRFSAGALPLTTLLEGMNDAEQVDLCADLSSLYLTGALRNIHVA